MVLPEVQAAFQLSAVGAGGILTSRELASGVIRLPGGILVDLSRRHWGLLLADCLLAAGIATLAIAISQVYFLLLVGIALVAMAHSIWHLPSSASLSYHFSEKRGVAATPQRVEVGVGSDVVALPPARCGKQLLGSCHRPLFGARVAVVAAQ